MNILSAVFCVADTIYCPPGDEFGGSLHECQDGSKIKSCYCRYELRAIIVVTLSIGVTLGREHCGEG